MKRFSAWLLLILLFLLLLSGCGADDPYTVTYNGEEYLFDFSEHTITHGGDVYTYEYGEDDTVRIVYPNGAVYISQWGNMQVEGKYDSKRYVPGDVLRDLIKKEDLPALGESESNISVIPGIGVLCLGLFFALAPESAWQMNHGWHYKNAEPSELSLEWHKISGVFLCIAGVVLLILGIFA